MGAVNTKQSCGFRVQFEKHNRDQSKGLKKMTIMATWDFYLSLLYFPFIVILDQMCPFHQCLMEFFGKKCDSYYLKIFRPSLLNELSLVDNDILPQPISFIALRL